MKRYNGAGSWVSQAIFTVLCLAGIGFASCILYAYISSAQGGGGVEGAMTIFLGALGYVIALIYAGILLIPFILLMIFCKKPWLSLIVYLLYAALLIAIICVYKLMPMPETEETALLLFAVL